MAQGLTATADDLALWVLIPEPNRPDTFTVLHHAYSDPPELMDKVQTLRGDIRPHSVAARDHTLWIIYTHGEVQAIRAQPTVLNDGWEYHSRVEPSLPDGVSVRATAMTSTGLWALVRVEDRKTLEELDTSGTHAHSKPDRDWDKRIRNIAIGLPPDYGIDDPVDVPQEEVQNDSADAATPDEDETTPVEDSGSESDATEAPDEPSLPVDRLLQLQHGRWRVHVLPENWSHGTQAWLVSENKSSEHPTLVARASGGGSDGRVGIDVYRHKEVEAGHWDGVEYTLGDDADADSLAFIGIEEQLVVAQSQFNRGQVSADLSVLRNGKIHPSHRMTLSDVPASQWVLLGSGSSATLLARQSSQATDGTDKTDYLDCVWTRMDVRGRILLEPTSIVIPARSAMDDLTQYIMLAFIAVLVTMLMLAFWRRDASWNQLDLPPELMIADLGWRAMAAAIDMTPGFVGSMLYFGMYFEDVMLRWPGNGIANTVEQVLPGTLVIVVFVGHTTLSELFFARTLGKLITGLRTTALDGTRPRHWQLLVRGLLKVLDLIPGAWLLLLLPVIAPHRQRLGDLVGRTVVVCDAPKQEEVKESDSDSERQ